MSVNRDMKDVTLKHKVKVRSEKSGATSTKWEDVGNIKAAIYKKDEFVVNQSEQYKEATHICIAHSDVLEAGRHSIVTDCGSYEVLSCIPSGRLKYVLLKENTNV